MSIESRLPAPKARKANCFDFLRLLAALAVVIQHSTYHLDLPFLWMERGSRWWFYDGVPLFFIISGLFVYPSCENCLRQQRPVREYFRNRLLRVCPALYFYAFATPLLLFGLGLLSVNVMSNPLFYAWLGSILCLIPVYNPPFFRPIGIGVLNGSLWTIPVEVSFYVTVPVLVLIARRWNFKTMCLLLALVALIGAVLHGVMGKETLLAKLIGLTFLPHLSFFALGIFWSRAWNRVPQSGWLAVLAAIGYIVLRSLEPITSDNLGPLWGVPLSYVVLWVGYHGPAILSRVMGKIGDLSYGVYIWHMVVVNVFLAYALPQRWSSLPGTLLIMLLIAITMLLALISWWVIEKPILARKKYSSRDPALRTSTEAVQ